MDRENWGRNAILRTADAVAESAERLDAAAAATKGATDPATGLIHLDGAEAKALFHSIENVGKQARTAAEMIRSLVKVLDELQVDD